VTIFFIGIILIVIELVYCVWGGTVYGWSTPCTKNQNLICNTLLSSGVGFLIVGLGIIVFEVLKP
jgi:hypothetical protein